VQRIIVQVPMDKKLKDKAEAASSDLGFSSLQEVIRVFLTKLSKREFNIKIEETSEEITDLSPAAEKKFKKAIRDIKAGRNITETKNTEELLRLLRE
jgi:antitoxin component of RelBE/YafQ-DinJ toxin-antitoxin module